MRDDEFRRSLDDYAAVGRDGAVPPMVHEIYRRGRRHQRLQLMTWSAVGALTLIATFLAGMVVRDQTNTAAAGVALPTTTTLMTGTTTSTLFDAFATSTTLFDPFATSTTLFPTSSSPLFPTTSFTTTSFTTTTQPTTTTRPTTTVAPLTSGRHTVMIKLIANGSVRYDKVQFFRGDDAVREAQKDGSSTTNGWYMRNENLALRTNHVKSGAPIRVTRKTMGRTGTPQNGLVTVFLHELATRIPTPSLTLFSITLEGGEIVAITEHDLS